MEIDSLITIGISKMWKEINQTKNKGTALMKRCKRSSTANPSRLSVE